MAMKRETEDAPKPAGGQLQRSRGPSPEEAPKRRKLCCDLGTGEYLSVLSYKAKVGKETEFDVIIQSIAHGLHHLTTGVTDVRVLHRHPPCGAPPEATFIVTFVSGEDRDMFEKGPQQDALNSLKDVIEGGAPLYTSSGHLMPDTHTFETLLEFMKKNVVGTSYLTHDIERVKNEMAKWFPRPEEYQKYIHWDVDDPKKYTRNLLYRNEHFDLVLMCWPPHSQSSIHCHDMSSCWVRIVHGEVWEVQYAIPNLDKKFLESQMKNPTGAVGRAGPLKTLGETRLSCDTRTAAYVNNTIGVHRVENRTDQPAYTVHLYAPGLQKMKLFKESGSVSLMCVAAVSNMTEHGNRTGYWGKHTSPDGVLDVELWNSERKGCTSDCSAKE